jgi:hypothetical protein
VIPIVKTEPVSTVKQGPPKSVSFLGRFPPKACKTVSFFVSFHQGATQSGILFLVSIERGTSRRVSHRRPWLSDMSQLRVLPVGSLRALAVARVGVVGRRAFPRPPRFRRKARGRLIRRATFRPIDLGRTGLGCHVS